MVVKASDLLGGKYRIVRCIGVGGMGSVYEAVHEGLGTRVAVKVLLSRLAQVPTLADRFQREARVSASIDSPHVIRVTDVDRGPDGIPYLVMELLEGESLQKRLDDAGRLERKEALDIVDQILVGLEHAHAMGVVHRDLKPDNAYLVQQGAERVVKLLDFGIAKVRASSEYQALTRPGTTMGTPEYMAPEQAFSAAEVDERSDLYSVGVMLYEMLSGRLPADGATPQEIAAQVMAGSVPRLSESCPELPEGLVAVVHHAMGAMPSQRPASARELRRALAPWSGASTTESGPAPRPRPAAYEATAAMSQLEVAKRFGVGGLAVTPAAEPLLPQMGTAPLPAAPEPAAPEPADLPSAAPPRAAQLAATAPLPESPPGLARDRQSRGCLRWAVTLSLLALAALVGLGAWLWLGRVDPGPPPPRPVPQSIGPKAVEPGWAGQTRLASASRQATKRGRSHRETSRPPRGAIADAQKSGSRFAHRSRFRGGNMTAPARALRAMVLRSCGAMKPPGKRTSAHRSPTVI